MSKDCTFKERMRLAKIADDKQRAESWKRRLDHKARQREKLND